MEAIITIKTNEQNHLSDEDKKLIKEVVLYKAKHSSACDFAKLTKELTEAFILINSGNVPIRLHQNHQS